MGSNAPCFRHLSNPPRGLLCSQPHSPPVLLTPASELSKLKCRRFAHSTHPVRNKGCLDALPASVTLCWTRDPQRSPAAQLLRTPRGTPRHPPPILGSSASAPLAGERGRSRSTRVLLCGCCHVEATASGCKLSLRRPTADIWVVTATPC